MDRQWVINRNRFQRSAGRPDDYSIEIEDCHLPGHLKKLIQDRQALNLHPGVNV